MTEIDISSVPFGEHDGKPVTLWTIMRQTTLGPVTLSMTDFGATIQRLILPDAKGTPTDIALGYDTLAEYVTCDTYFGATVGRYGNRIRAGHVMLDGNSTQLDLNEGHNHLHGGRRGFDKVVWAGAPTVEGDGLSFQLTSPDGDMGYPGKLEIIVTYRLTAQGGLDVDMTATTDRTTICNVVQHSLWNLGGHAAGHVRDHVAQLAAGFVTPVDDDLIPTGEVCRVDGTPFDFGTAKPIGRDMSALTAAGYDHNLVLGLLDAEGWRDCADVLCPANGLGFRLRTDQPAVQFYAGTYLTPDVVGKGNVPYQANAGFALETQIFPDSPHHAHFPQAILRSHDTYRHRMAYSFYHAGPASTQA
ncbi:aldose epimerase family protein [Loktanella sp. DJP18]|uniref:aldose epimerase family protein n=1 Tax=Loktanella sp. DJP18 TaxID=3409788 RepID=UPI003BB6A69C